MRERESLSQAAKKIYPGWRPRCYMSDMAPCHYNGFVDGFSWDEEKQAVCPKKKDAVLRDTARLLCDFHVRQVFTLSFPPSLTPFSTEQNIPRPWAEEWLRTSG